MSKSPSGPAAAMLAPAEVVAGRYRVVSVLAPPTAGSLGATYSVVDLAAGTAPLSSQSGGRELTLRLLTDPGSPGGSSSLSDEDRERFSQQAAHLGAVRHPAVARTYELGLLGEQGVFLTREPVEAEGQTLRDVLALRGGPLPEDEAIVLCAQIGEALEAVHLHGACHLGLSPSCIYVYPSGSGVRLKVADFGLLPPAWAARVGEAGYLAPEQVDAQLGGYICDRRTDQFALAVILYEMLAGQPAFIAAADEDRRIVLGRVRNEDPLPLAQSRGVEQALARALSRSRAVRFSSVRDFMRALGADVSGWPTGTSLAPAGPPGGGRPPRVFLPMAIGALCALLSLGGAVALRHYLTSPATPGRAVTVPDLASSADLRPPGGAPVDLAASGPAVADAAAGAAAISDAAPVTDEAPSEEPTPDATDGGDSPEHFPPLRLAGPIADGPARSPLRIPPKHPAPVPSPALKADPRPAQPALLPLQFGSEAGLLTDEQHAQLEKCVKMISPQPPFQVLLQNINDTLYVDSERSSAQFSGSQDFRDCLKLSVKGKIVPKVLTITRPSRGKAAP